MIILKFIRNGLVLTGLLIATGCATTSSDTDDPTARMEVAEVYDEASRMMRSGDYANAVVFYERLESRFPYGKYAERAQMEIAYAYYKDNEPESAIVAADRFIKLHPNHPNVDYLYYLRGLASYDMSKNFFESLFDIDKTERDPKAARRSFGYFSELVKKFPKSRYNQDAIARMANIRDSLAKHELHVASYYMKKGAYLAAVNRGKYIVENYQRTTAVPDALVVMIKGYKKLGMKDLAQDTRKILEFNYPNHSFIKK